MTYDRGQYYYQRLEKEINKYLAEHGLMEGYALVVSVSPYCSAKTKYPQASGYIILHFDDKAAIVTYDEGIWWGEAHVYDEWESAITALAKFMASYKYRWKIHIWTGLSRNIDLLDTYTWRSRDVEKRLKGDCSG